MIKFINHSKKNIKTIVGKRNNFFSRYIWCPWGISSKSEKISFSLFVFCYSSNRSPKIPVVEFNKLKKKTKEKITNKFLYDLFIKFS